MEKLTVSVAETATALGISETLVRELIASGELPAVRAGKRVLVPVQGLRDYSAGLETEQVAGQG